MYFVLSYYPEFVFLYQISAPVVYHEQIYSERLLHNMCKNFPVYLLYFFK